MCAVDPVKDLCESPAAQKSSVILSEGEVLRTADLF